MIPPTAIEVLSEARKLLERGWTQCTYARDLDGNGVEPRDRNAVAWCIRGALCKARDRWFGDQAERRLQQMVGGAGLITNWNDTAKRTQAEVLALLDQAIAAEGGAP